MIIIFAIVDIKMRNNIANIKKILAISIIDNYLKKWKEPSIWKFLKLGSIKAKKVKS